MPVVGRVREAPVYTQGVRNRHVPACLWAAGDEGSPQRSCGTIGVMFHGSGGEGLGPKCPHLPDPGLTGAPIHPHLKSSGFKEFGVSV